jgi:diguanylate cyclase (GGDEF)-like protein/PAS domain S-box-containing protein
MALRSTLRRLFGREAAPRDTTPGKDAAEASFRKVVEQSADVICRVFEGQFVYVSPSAFDVFGWDAQKLVGTNGMDVIHEEDRHIVQESIVRMASGEQDRTTEQVRVKCGDGSFKWIETRSQTETPGSIRDVILVMRDVTERKQLEEQLAVLALQDGLTGLANRRAFDQTLDREWERTLRTGGEMALLLLDIDCFKQFNDLYGHQAGDDCLRTVASCIRECAVGPTDMACRYGGEEIVVILGNTSLDTAMAIAEKMRTAVAALEIPHQGNACADRITVSIGVAAAIARSGGSARMPEGLVQAADHALYKAKANGRNTVEQSILIAPSGQ